MAVSRKSDDGKITLYTIQREAAFEALEKDGVLYGKKERIIEGFGRAYNWMVRQMVNRGIVPESAEQEYPVWAWYKLNGKKPDLRTGGFSKRGTPLVMMTIKVDPSRVLCSDFEFWHYVLNKWALTKNEAEDELFEDDRYFRANHSKTWQRVFDIDDHELTEYHYGSDPAFRSIQAVLWAVKKDDVVAVRHFIAK